MEWEEELLEPWQKKVNNVEEEEEEKEELVFVGERSSSKPALSNILNKVDFNSYLRVIRNGALSRGFTAAFKPTSQHCTTHHQIQ